MDETGTGAPTPGTRCSYPRSQGDSTIRALTLTHPPPPVTPSLRYFVTPSLRYLVTPSLPLSTRVLVRLRMKSAEPVQTTRQVFQAVRHVLTLAIGVPEVPA
jgi:hypothetical protein